MNDRTAARPGARSAPAVLTSVPWLVVLVGVGLLATLLVVAMLSFRGPEHRAAAPPPAPPLYLPTLPPAASASPSPAGREEVATTVVTSSPPASPSPSPSAASSSASASPSAARPSASAEAPVVLDAAGSSGTLSARYQVVATDRDSFDAQLRLDNGSGQAQEWQVELAFAGNVKTATVLSPGISVTVGGGYVLRGASALAAGQSTTVTVRFLRNGAGDQPGRCTVNGAACTIG
ncbi:hypothetical protein K7640_12060 [Micromonospora sp. PLK6-60]|uniref:hypothetical protein n=1 Tax=Micromonospora sp. PLK6-60 TaxID=2873383 RepID=UPI001CA68A71|nr:hypothetical protein [Micromonospora sp. PLK6-60]MBY8872568.1 hypothetical protein [Micromonospora sp. PLK6-60]